MEIRDPIHGFINFSEDEIRIINSAPFQRLRHIRQLALTSLIYPGAVHTRFEHSLGVTCLVSQAFDSAIKKFAAITIENIIPGRILNQYNFHWKNYVNAKKWMKIEESINNY